MSDKWDRYFLDLCNVVASNSECHSRKIGCLLVRDRSIVATGYNGPARGIPHCREECTRRKLGYPSGKGLHMCRATHAEVNCIANAARLGVSTLGSTLYINTVIPCKDCLSALINAGIWGIVAKTLDYYDDLSHFIWSYSTIRIRRFHDREFLYPKDSSKPAG